MVGGYYTRSTTSADLLPLTDDVIHANLSGTDARGREHYVGLYLLRPDDTCVLLACDFDGASWRADAYAYHQACAAANIPAVTEVSRSGDRAHVWIFFDGSMAATQARSLGAAMRRAPRQPHRVAPPGCLPEARHHCIRRIRHLGASRGPVRVPLNGTEGTCGGARSTVATEFDTNPA